MKEALGRILGSAKFWTTIIGMIVTAGASLFARYGLELSDEAIQQIAITVAGFFGVLLGGQALADHGKHAAEIAATAAVVSPAPAPNQTVVVQAPQAGEIKAP